MSNPMILLLGAMLLVQCCKTVPVPGPETAIEDVSNSDEELTARDELQIFVFNEFVDIIKLSMERGEAILKKVVRADRPPVFEEHKKTLVSYLRHYDETKQQKVEDNLEGFLKTFLNFTKILDRFDTDDLKEPTPEDYQMEKLFQENGLNEFVTELKKRFCKFFDDFDEQFNRYVQSLSEADREKEGELLAWYSSFKDEKDYLKKFGIFPKVYKLF